MPYFLEEDILQQIFSNAPVQPNSPMQNLQDGLKCLGIHQVSVNNNNDDDDGYH